MGGLLTIRGELILSKEAKDAIGAFKSK